MILDAYGRVIPAPATPYDAILGEMFAPMVADLLRPNRWLDEGPHVLDSAGRLVTSRPSIPIRGRTVVSPIQIKEPPCDSS